ncbi:MAG: SMI1/KNR4 family protein [Ruminococcus sp.]|nr:SMI1/KNR4 family protein [Ruminococcus sp.]
MEINWILSTPTSKADLDYAEKQFNVTFPKEYSELVLNYNFAYAEPNCVCVNGRERVFERLLSINESDRTNIFNFSEIVSENCGKNLIAFGSDPFGNYWCFDYNNGNDEPVIVYYDHESAFEYEDYEPQFVCSSFRELLDNITESQEE